MYKCDECGNIFEEPARWQEERSGDGWAWEDTGGSPCCKSGYYEVDECECCGVNYTDDDYCDECLRDFEDTMEEAQANMGIDYNTFCRMVEHWIDGR